MTTALPQQPAAPTSAQRLLSAMRAERLSALATPAAKILLVMSVLMASISTVANLSAVDDLTEDWVVQLTMHASTVATLIFAILAGLYSATTDLRFGVMDQRLLSEPNRPLTMAAKSFTALQTGVLYAVLGAITAVVAASAFYAANGESFDIGSPFVRRALVGLLVAAPLFAVLGVAIGLIITNQPFAIGATMAWLLVVEPVLIIGAPDVGKWLPGAAGIALTNNPDSLMQQMPAGLLLATYAVAFSTLALARFGRSDV